MTFIKNTIIYYERIMMIMMIKMESRHGERNSDYILEYTIDRNDNGDDLCYNNDHWQA